MRTCEIYQQGKAEKGNFLRCETVFVMQIALMEIIDSRLAG